MKPLTNEDLEQRYQDIFELYHQAEELLATVESGFVTDAETQLMIVEPLVALIGDTTDLLTEQFMDAARDPANASHTGRKKIETALRKLYLGLESYTQRTKQAQQKAVVSLHNIADPIVLRIKRQLERVVAIFIEMLGISVHLIMNKHEIERLKQHEARVALMLHQTAQQHS